MRVDIRNIGILLLLILASRGFAQRSCVFLDEDEHITSFDRLRPSNKPIHIVTEESTIQDGDFPNIDVSRFYLNDENEPSIAINPTDPKNIIVVAND
jgi:hypothetical protein